MDQTANVLDFLKSIGGLHANGGQPTLAQIRFELLEAQWQIGELREEVENLREELELLTAEEPGRLSRLWIRVRGWFRRPEPVGDIDVADDGLGEAA